MTILENLRSALASLDQGDTAAAADLISAAIAQLGGDADAVDAAAAVTESRRGNRRYPQIPAGGAALASWLRQ